MRHLMWLRLHVEIMFVDSEKHILN